jgi:hypothetical protein
MKNECSSLLTGTASASCALLIPLIALLVFQSSIAKAATIENNDTGFTSLSFNSNWTGGAAPGVRDIALWDAGSPSGTFALGAPLSWEGIKIGSAATGNPAGAITIAPDGNTLTLGVGGIDMTAATQSLAMRSNLTLGGGSQAWNVASGQTLTFDTGTFTRTVGSTVTFSGGEGTISSSMPGLSSSSLSNGIVGPWAIVNTSGTSAPNAGGGYTYATFGGIDIVPYTGATPETATAGGAFGGIPSGDTSTVNYDIGGGISLGILGLFRSVNTMRYLGSGGTQLGNNTNTLIEMNGFMNAGTGTFIFGTTGNVT